MSSKQSSLVKNILSKPVSDYMIKEVIQLEETYRVSWAIKIMKVKKHDEVIVLKDGKPVGIVTSSNILEKISQDEENSHDLLLKDVTSYALRTIEEKSSIKEALLKMRDFNVRRLVVTSKGKIVGVIFRSTISDAVKNSLIVQSKIGISPFKSIIGNLGFVLQFSGVLMIIPAIISTILAETISATGIFFMTISLLSVGFFLNSYGEKFPLRLREAAILVVISYFVLSLFGTIPYIYLNPYGAENAFEIFSNSFFSSTSGMTTTGLSLFDKPEDLPQTFTFYRSFSQFVGGLSFIYLIIIALYPEEKLQAMRGFITGKTLHFRELFGTITIIFTIYALIIAFLLYYFGERDLLDNFSFAMSAVSTGGFLPHSELLVDLIWEEYIVVIVAMVLGALPFTFHYGSIRRKFLPPKMEQEVIIYLIILTTGSILFVIFSNQGILEGFFMAAAGSTTTGFQILDPQALSENSKILIMILMLIGGCGFSTAGGIKIYRFMSFRLKSKDENQYDLEQIKKKNREIIIVLALFPLIPFLMAIHLNNMGYDFTDSYFEAISAIATDGLSTGIVNLSMDPFTKIMFGFLMIFGRLEIIMVIYAIIPKLIP